MIIPSFPALFTISMDLLIIYFIENQGHLTPLIALILILEILNNCL